MADNDDDDAPRDLTAVVSEGWSPSPLPPIAADGGPVLEPAQPFRVLRDEDWICLRGPCRRYHRMVTSMDAQKPVDGSLEYEDGTPVGDPQQVVHTCYPSPGREMSLNDVVVTECNLWDPETNGDRLEREHRRRLYYEEVAAEAVPDSDLTPKE